MGRRAQKLTQILGFEGFKVVSSHFEDAAGTVVEPVGGFAMIAGTRLVLGVARRWLPRCGQCFGACGRTHDRLGARRWEDRTWGDHPVVIEYAPVRVKCTRCDATPVELVAWADRGQRQTRRLQQYLAVLCASMPTSHVAAMHGLSWSTVTRAEEAALTRWSATRTKPPLRHVGVDEKWLGRRHKLAFKYLTIVSNLETGEPLWIGYGRSEATLASWLATLSTEDKRALVLFAMDMHRPFFNAVRNDADLVHVAIVHDPFHVIKRAGDALDELRRQAFFRASEHERAVGRGTRFLVLRSWEKSTTEQRANLRLLFHFNSLLGRAYQIVEELREVLKAPDAASLTLGLHRILRRTASRRVTPLRKLHESLRNHFTEIVALGEYRPATGRTEALNNNWETLVRRGHGYRNHQYLLLKLAFMTANPLRTDDGLKRFQALGMPTPHAKAAA